MTENKSLFVKLDESINSRVKIGDNRLVNAARMGVVSVKFKYENKLLKDVMYVPGLA